MVAHSACESASLRDGTPGFDGTGHPSELTEVRERALPWMWVHLVLLSSETGRVRPELEVAEAGPFEFQGLDVTTESRAHPPPPPDFSGELRRFPIYLVGPQNFSGGLRNLSGLAALSR